MMMNHELDASEPALALDKLVIRHTVREAIKGRGDCDGYFSFDGISGGFSVGVDVQRDRACYSVMRPLASGKLEIVDHGSIVVE